MQARGCTANFKATSRDYVRHAERNRTETPAVGHYTPRYVNVDSNKWQDLKISESKMENQGFTKKT